jgi:sulfur carrier protein ThiS
MQVQLKLFGLLGDVGKQGFFSVEEGITLEGFLSFLSNQFGFRFRKELYDSTTMGLSRHLCILINSKPLSSDSEHLQLRLQEGDVVSILPIVGGG